MGYMLILLLTTPVEIGPFTSMEDCHAAAAAVTQAVETNGASFFAERNASGHPWPEPPDVGNSEFPRAGFSRALIRTAAFRSSRSGSPYINFRFQLVRNIHFSSLDNANAPLA